MREQEHITPIDQHVIDFVRDLRGTKELTQQDMANILGISRTYFTDIESPNSRAKYNLRLINALADYFNLPPGAFLPLKALPPHFPGRGPGDKLVKKKPTGAKTAKIKKVAKKGK